MKWPKSDLTLSALNVIIANKIFCTTCQDAQIKWSKPGFACLHSIVASYYFFHMACYSDFCHSLVGLHGQVCPCWYMWLQKAFSIDVYSYTIHILYFLMYFIWQMTTFTWDLEAEYRGAKMTFFIFYFYFFYFYTLVKLKSKIVTLGIFIALNANGDHLKMSEKARLHACNSKSY